MTGDSSTRQGVDEDLLRSLWPELVRLGRLLTGSQQQGEDIAQEAILVLLQRSDIRAPKAYLRRTLVNLSINHARRSSRERAYLATAVHEGSHADAYATAEIDELWPLVVSLPVRQRAVLVLRYYEDLSEAQIASVLGCRPGTVKSLASRALQRLREELPS